MSKRSLVAACASLALLPLLAAPRPALAQSAEASYDDGWPHRVAFEAPGKSPPKVIIPTYPGDGTVGPSPEDPRGLEGKIWAGVLYSMLGGVALSIGTYAATEAWLVHGDLGTLSEAEAKGAANFAVLAAMPVGYAIGGGVGVYRLGESYGHRGQLLYTVGGAVAGSALFGLTSYAASREILETSGVAGRDAVRPILMSGMALGSLIGSTLGSVAGYEIFDNHRYEYHRRAIKIGPTALSDGAKLAPGLGLIAQF